MLIRAFAVTLPASALSRLGLYSTMSRGVATDERGRGASFRRWRYGDYDKLLADLTKLGFLPEFADKTWRLPMASFARIVSDDPLTRRSGFTFAASPIAGGLGLQIGLEYRAPGESFVAAERPFIIGGKTLLAPTLITVAEPGTLVVFGETSRRQRRFAVGVLRYRTEPGCPLAGRTPIGPASEHPE